MTKQFWLSALGSWLSARSRSRAPSAESREPTAESRALIAFAVLLLAACGGKDDDKKNASRQPQVVPVVVAVADTGTIPITLATDGTVEAVQSVALQARVAGAVLAVRFAEGEEVRQGQVLFEIDPRPARAALDQARAVLARDQASAAAASADAARYASLVQKGYVTQSQADQQRANASALGATVAADRALVEAASLTLSYTTVRAPISGKTGNLNVRVGNQVSVPNPTPLVVINAVSPVQIRFTVPDRELPALRAADAAGHGLTVAAGGASTGGVAEQGIVQFIDNAVDTVSGSVLLKARFPNQDRRLWPGAYMPVTLTLGQTAGAVVVPSVAVQQGPEGAYVFIPDDKGKARQVPVVVSRTMSDVSIVTKGVSRGDRVVVDGQSRLFAGASLKVARTQGFAIPGREAPPMLAPAGDSAQSVPVPAVGSAATGGQGGASASGGTPGGTPSSSGNAPVAGPGSAAAVAASSPR